MGAYENLQQLGIRTLVVQEESIEEAVAAFLAGSLQNQPDLLQ